MGTVQVRTARKWHPCSGWRCPVGVLAGTQYRREVIFPGDEGHEDGTRPVALATCSRCINEQLAFHRDKYGVPATLGIPVTSEGRRGIVVGAYGSDIAVILAGSGTSTPVDARWRTVYHTPDGDVSFDGAAKTTCESCDQTVPTVSVCCSSHQTSLCHGCYRRSHFVERCVEGCVACADEGLPARMR